MESGSITEFGTERTIEQRRNMQQVIDWLAKGAPHTVLKDGSMLDGFNYSNYIEASGDTVSDDTDSTTGQCGTVGCIAGAAVQFDSPVPVSDGMPVLDFSVEYKAQKILGLSYKEAQLLFYPFSLDYTELTEIYYVGGLALSVAYNRTLELGFDDTVDDEYSRTLELGFDDMVDDEYSYMPLAELEYAEPRQIARVLQLFQDTGVINWYILEG
jgi:hypothetical protein